MKEKVIMIGAGGHAKSILAMLQQLGSYEIFGYVDFHENGSLGIPYLGDDTNLEQIRKDIACAVLGVGQVKSAAPRKAIIERLKNLDFSLPVVAAVSAVIAPDALLDEGSVVMEKAVVNAGVRIGKCAIVNTGAIIEHDCVIGDFVHVAVGAVVCGGVVIGNECLVGAGGTIIENRCIHDNVVVGAGACVIEDLSQEGTYAGVPTRKIG